MHTKIPEKLLNIVADIDAHGQANLTRLTVLKKWFERPERLTAFALWVAERAASRKGKAGGAEAGLFKEARALLSSIDKSHPKIEKLDRKAAESLHDRLREFQNEHKRLKWVSVRIVNDWNLMLVEEALAICLWYINSPAHGYKLAADYCQNYDPQYGDSLNGPSRKKLLEMGRFISAIEAHGHENSESFSRARSRLRVSRRNIPPRQTEAMENLARYIIRASFSQGRLRYDAPSATVVYKGKDGSRQKTFERSFGLMCRGLPENRQKRV